MAAVNSQTRFKEVNLNKIPIPLQRDTIQPEKWYLNTNKIVGKTFLTSTHLNHTRQRWFIMGKFSLDILLIRSNLNDSKQT